MIPRRHRDSFGDRSVKTAKSRCRRPADVSVEPLFSRRMATLVKGVAVILLVLHHLFLFPSVRPGFVDLFGGAAGRVEFFLSSVGKICIPMFFFVSGYGLYLSSQRDEQPWRSSFRRIARIYTVYCVSVSVTVVLLYLSSGRWALRSVSQTVTTYLGLNVGINGGWWFFIIYVELLLLTPLMVYLTRRFSWKTPALLSLLLYLLSPAGGFTGFSRLVDQAGLSSLFYSSFPIRLFWYNQLYFCTGFCLAAGNGFETVLRAGFRVLANPLQRRGAALLFISLIFLFRYNLVRIGAWLGIFDIKDMDIYRYTAVNTWLDWLLGPLLLFFLVLLLHGGRWAVLRFLGSHSAAIWLIHGAVIVLVTGNIGDFRPWSPLLFAAVLGLSCGYAWLYGEIAGRVGRRLAFFSRTPLRPSTWSGEGKR